MSDKNSEGQVIFDLGVRLSWKKSVGNGYSNMHLGNKERPFQMVSRAKSIDHINRSPEMIAKLMAFTGLTGKKVYDFHVSEEYYRKEISRSFTHREEDYEREFGKDNNE